MNDLEIFEQMLKRAKIAYTKRKLRGKYLGQTSFTIEAGYAGFASDILFDEAGNLLSIEAFE